MSHSGSRVYHSNWYRNTRLTRCDLLNFCNFYKTDIEDDGVDDNNHDDNVDEARQPTQSDISAAVAKANKALSPLDLAIRSARSQRDSAVTTYALVMLGTVDQLGQSQSTQQHQLQINSQHASFGGGGGSSGGVGSSQAWPSPTTYTADEQAYIRRVLDAIFETNNTPRAEVMAVKGMQAVRLHRAPQQQHQDQVSTQDANAGEWQNRQAQTIPMAQAEKLLARLAEEGWLERSEKGWYSLGMRGLIELKEWLVETYNGGDEDEDEDEEGEEGVNSRRRSRGQNRQKWERIKFCDACKDIITIVGFRRLFIIILCCRITILSSSFLSEKFTDQCIVFSALYFSILSYSFASLSSMIIVIFKGRSINQILGPTLSDPHLSRPPSRYLHRSVLSRVSGPEVYAMWS